MAGYPWVEENDSFLLHSIAPDKLCPECDSQAQHPFARDKHALKDQALSSDNRPQVEESMSPQDASIVTVMKSLMVLLRQWLERYMSKLIVLKVVKGPWCTSHWILILSVPYVWEIIFVLAKYRNLESMLKSVFDCNTQS